MEKISEHISYSEATRSSTGTAGGINNTPNEKQLSNMKALAENVFEPLRSHYGVPITVNSFFRSKELNAAVGGSSTSQHMTGEAIDIDATGNVQNSELFNYIENNLPFDQLIWEFGDDKNPDWVHVSFSKTKNRKQIIRAFKEKGKTVYKPYK